VGGNGGEPCDPFGEGGTAVLGLSHPACKLRPVGAAWEARRLAANGRRAQVSLSAMTATSAPTVPRHHWAVRLTHLATVIVLAGFAVYKPTQLAWLTTLFGGFQAARYWHFWIVWIFVGFTIMHVILVFAVDPASLRAMLTGSYRGRFPSHD